MHTPDNRMANPRPAPVQPENPFRKSADASGLTQAPAGVGIDHGLGSVAAVCFIARGSLMLCFGVDSQPV